MLETIREHAAQLLAESGGEEVEVRTRHSDWVRALVADDSTPFYALAPARVALVGAQEDNLRVALDWLASVDSDACTQLCADAAAYWQFTTRLTEALSRLEYASAYSASRQIDPLAHVPILLAEVLQRLGDVERATQVARGGVDLARRLGDDVLLAEAMRSQGNALQAGGDLDAAEAAFTKSSDVARRVDHDIGVRAAAVSLGMIAIERGEYERGRALSADGARAADPYTRLVGTSNQGLALLGLSRPAEAEDLFAESLEIIRCLGFDWPEGLVASVDGLAIVHVASGDHKLAVRAAGAATRVRVELGLREEEPLATLLRTALETARAALGAEPYQQLIAVGGATPLNEIARELLATSTRRSMPR
jgi:tetratricopeptide (TPR) repeat protein